MEDIHFHRFHAVEISTYHIERNEMPDRIDHESAPREARPILNCQGWDRKSFRRHIDQLEKRLKSMQRSERRRRSQPGASWSDFENMQLNTAWIDENLHATGPRLARATMVALPDPVLRPGAAR